MDAIRTIMTLTAAFLAISCSGLRKAAGSEEKVSVACAAEIDYSGAGTADIDITASVPEEFRNPNTGIILVPVLVSKDGTKKMPLLSCIAEGSLHNTFNGRNDIYEPDLSDSISVRKRYSRHGATGLESLNAVGFEEWMRESSVHVDIYADAYCRRVLLSSETFPVSATDPNAFADLEFREKYFHVRPSESPGPADFSPLSDGFLFRLDSYSIDDEDIRTEMTEYVRGMLTRGDVRDYSVSAVVSNSPEGSLEYNRNLGNNRMQAVKNLLSEAGVDMDRCTFSVIEENWSGVRQAVSEGFSEHKDEILAVVDSVADPDLRENIIRDRFYREWLGLRRDVYPGLRYCSLEITGSILPDSFCVSRETDYAQESEADAAVLNESMLEEVMAGDYKGAESVADMLPNSGIPEKILYNKALVYLKNGRKDEAGALLRRCTGISEARYNLAVLYIMSRDYAAAEPLLEDCDCINRAVVKAALGKETEARDILVLLPDSDAKAGLTEMLEK